MATQFYERFDGSQITEKMLDEASLLFSENYGVWGDKAAKVVGDFAKAGRRVRLSRDRLRAEYFPNDADCFYVRVTVDGHLAGNVVACRWTSLGETVCWITQLVVDHNYRERGLATGLLNQLKQDDVDIYGLMSSHPAAFLAATRALGGSLNTIKLSFIKEHAQRIMAASPIAYVKRAKLCGSAFKPGDASGLVSSVDTNFFVDHSEPLEALAWVREGMEWPLGELFDGHEFLLVFEARRRFRSRSRSLPRQAANKDG